MSDKSYKIVVNTRLLIKNRTDGIARFTYETLKKITRKYKEHHFIFLFDRPFDEEFIFSDNITPIVLSPQARHPVLFYWWFELSVANVLNKLKPDLFLSPDGYLSLNASCKSLPVIHDINFAHHPEDLPFLVRKYYNYFFPKFAAKANRIATVSEYSKQDIHKTYGINKDKIDVVYNGISESFKPLDKQFHKLVKDKYTNGQDYFLFVGSLHPRKNIARLLKAYDEFRKQYNGNVKLLVVGDKYWWNNDIESEYNMMQYKNDVIFTGSLHDEQLVNVYGAALVLTYVPYFEGFGIPVLEAMRCDIPVICSDTTSLPEVAGDAALYINPLQVESITNAMIKVATDDIFRNTLIEKGRARALSFSWDNTADLLWNSIEKTIEA